MALTSLRDPARAAGAEARIINGAMRLHTRHPIIVVGRVLLLLAIAAPALGPLTNALRHLGNLPAPFAITGIAVIAWAIMRLFPTRR